MLLSLLVETSQRPGAGLTQADKICIQLNFYLGVASGCGCKEVYRFPHITYPYSSCTCSFLQQHPYSLFIFKNVFHIYI